MADRSEHFWRRLALCAATGVPMFLSCAPADLWPLAWVALVPLLWAVDGAGRPRRAFAYGLATGMVANGGGFYWITGLLERFAHLPLAGAIPLYLLLVAYQALLYGAFGLVVWYVRRSRPRIPLTLLAPVALVALELVTPFIFPWYYAITQAHVRPVIQIADLTGPLGITGLLALVNGALYDLLDARRTRRPAPVRTVAIGAALLAASLTYGAVRIHQVERVRAAAPKLTVGLVQPNLGIPDERHGFRPRLELEELRRLSADLEQRGARLVVWPEGSYPATIPEHPLRADLPGAWAVHGDGFDVPAVIGALTWGPSEPAPYNSAFLLGADGRVDGFYDKNFLLMFGEYIPFYDELKWIQKLVPAASNLARGRGVSVLRLPSPGAPGGAWNLAPMICYEDILPSFVRRLAPLRPNLLVNITNDAWFGATAEPYEHLELAVYRAVEHRLDMVRAVNTGVSAFVDSTGRIYRTASAVDPGENPNVPPATLLDTVALQEDHTVYAAVGDLFGYLNLAALLALLALARWRPRRPSK